MTKRLEFRTIEYNELMRVILNEVKAIDELKQSSETTALEKIREHEQIIEDLQMKLEVTEADLDDIQARLPLSDNVDGGAQGNKNESSAAKMIVNLPVPTIRTLLWDLLDSMTETEVR